MENEKDLECDNTCCVRNLVLLYEGEEFREYLEHHVANYKLRRKEISITLQGVGSPSDAYSSRNAFNPPVFEHDNITKGAALIEYINEFAGIWDGAIFPSHMTGALEESNQLWDLNDYLLKHRNNEKETNSKIEWSDILPFFRSQAQQHVGRRSRPRPSSFFEWKSLTDRDADRGGEVSTRTLYAPLDGDVMSLFYRKDIFEKHQIPVPRTWEEYRDVAIYLYGKPWGPNNSTLAGSCVVRKASTSSDVTNDMDSYMASLVLSTMTQTKGTASGFLLDPETAEPILGEAMDETLLFLAQESVLSEDDNSDSSMNDLPSVAWRLNEGSCPMTLSWANLLTLLIDSEELEHIGVAPTPGSKRIFDRASGKLKTCTPALCPYGTYYDDIGIVNRPSFSAFGGWVGGVSSGSTSSKQNDMADFFSYISNPRESLSDALPNERSNFVSPYRYSQTAASQWVGAGLAKATALQYAKTISEVNSENTVSDIRISTGGEIRSIINQEVQNYLFVMGKNKFEVFQQTSSLQDDLQSGVAPDMGRLRSGITANMDRRIRDIIATADTKIVLENYQSSLSFHNGPGDVAMNYIEIPYRDTGWGVAILICFGSIAVMLWVLRHRKKPVMRAFQPILLIQTALGLFFMGATLFPLGFDDSLFSKDILDITCMVTPWVYVFGFTIFFSSIYSKIQVCTKIFENPGKYDRMAVRPRDSLILFCKLFALNGTLLALWTVVDPLKWSRIEKTTYGSPHPFAATESYGSCKSENFRYPGFAIALFAFNLLCCFIAMLQALRCRLLVLEYRQMQWLQLCIVPFFEAWIIGGPVIVLLHEQPTAQYVAFVLIIASSTITSASAIFGPKEWYVRKHTLLSNEIQPESTPTPFIRILKHPKFESQKHVSNLQYRLERYTTSNTELAIDIRVLQEKFRLLTEKEKLAAVRGSIYSRGIMESEHSRRRLMMTDYGEESNTETRDSDIGKATLRDMKHKRNQIDEIITKNSSSNPRVSELSIDMEDLTQLRSEADKLLSQDDSGRSGGKSGRSMLFIESIAGNSFACDSRISEESNEDIATSNHGLELDVEGQDVLSFSSVNESKDISEDMEDLNQMIEYDNMRDLQSEAMLMAEEFKLSNSLLEDVSDLQPDISERDRMNLQKMVHSDDVGDLQSETILMAEKFKLNNGMLESVSDLKVDDSETFDDNSKDDGFLSLDVSNATVTSASSATMVTENYTKVITAKPAVNSSSSSNSKSNGPEAKPMSSTGESSGSHILTSETNSVEQDEGSTKNQDAGEPSSDSHSLVKTNGDIVVHQTYSNELKNGDIVVPQSSINELNEDFIVPLNSVNTTKTSVLINGWTPASAMIGLLSEISDSTSTSSRTSCVSIADSVASLEILPSPRESGVELGKDIETLLNRHGFDTGRVEADTRAEETSTSVKNETGPSKLSTTRQKKRELEAKRLAIRRHDQKGRPRSSGSSSSS